MIAYPHPLYDLGPIILESALADMKSMLTQIKSRSDLGDAQTRRVDLFSRLVDRYDLVLGLLNNWCAAANLIHQGKANIDEQAYSQIHHLVGPDMDAEQEYSTTMLMNELASAILELHAKPASNARTAGLAVMGAAYNIFYQIHFYFHNGYPHIQKFDGEEKGPAKRQTVNK